jgi:hypothetical protein
VNRQGPGKIDWTDFTWNPVTGCYNNCPYCYARRIAGRFRSKNWSHSRLPRLSCTAAQPSSVNRPPFRQRFRSHLLARAPYRAGPPTPASQDLRLLQGRAFW